MTQFFKFQILPLTPPISMLNLAKFCCRQKPKTLPTTLIWGERGFFTGKQIFYFVSTVLSKIVGTKFQLKLTSLIFFSKFAQKGDFLSKTEKSQLHVRPWLLLTIATFHTQRPGNQPIYFLRQKILATIFFMKTVPKRSKTLITQETDKTMDRQLNNMLVFIK